MTLDGSLTARFWICECFRSKSLTHAQVWFEYSVLHVAIGKEYYESLSLADKRKLYKCGHKYLTLDRIDPWSETRKKIYPGRNEVL